MWNLSEFSLFQLRAESHTRAEKQNKQQTQLGSVSFFFFLRFIFYLFLYICLHWVLIAVHGLSLVAGSRGHSLLQ